jgi:hypothetical protein
VLMPGEEATAFQPPPLTSDVYRLLDKMDNLIQEHGLLPVLQGNVADYTAGYPMQQRTHAARARYAVIAEHLREGWAQLGHLLTKMVQVLDVPVTVLSPLDEKEGGSAVIEMTPKRASQPRLISADWPMALPTDLGMLARIARMVTEPVAPGKEPLMDIHSARKEFLDDNEPELTSRRIDREDFRNTVKQAAIQYAMQMVQQGLQQAQGLIPPPAETQKPGAMSFIGQGVQGQMPGNPQSPGLGEAAAQVGPRGPMPGETGGEPNIQPQQTPISGPPGGLR